MPPLTRQQVGSAIAQLMPRIIQGIQLDVFVRRGVTQTQFLVLMAIHGYRHCPMGVLARSLHVRMPTATGVVKRLVRAGLIRRLPRREDRRHVIVELTPKGRRFIAQFQQVIRTRWEDVLRSLDQEELEAFHRVITKLIQQLQHDQ
ncbi:MAG: MarR family transcriptional regulator [Candidatus Omnitrophota bacterium]|nr:MarR family transcriptional regulator [Candidatus Omnitrophota bacterium]